MKNKADVVIIGGGIQGTDCAYHLAKRGITNIALVEPGYDWKRFFRTFSRDVGASHVAARDHYLIA